MKKHILIALVLILTSALFVAPASAQLGQTNYCDDSVSVVYGDLVTGQITNANFASGFCFEGRANEQIVVTVTVTNGNLQPFVFISDPNLVEVFTSNADTAGAEQTIVIGWTVPENGQYLIGVSRAGVESGTTTGGFELKLDLGNGSSGPGLGNPEDDLVFNVTCTINGQTSQEVRGGVQFSFINVNPGYPYTVTVFGLDNFDPVLAVEYGVGIGTCNDDESAAAGSELAVPGFGYISSNRLTSQVRFTTRNQGDPVNITVGALGGNSGQFVMVLEGLAISPSTELDGFVIRVPSSVAQETLGVYMVSRYTDLDPILSVWNGEGLNQAFDEFGEFYPDFIDYNNLLQVFECDDAGAGTCADTPPFPTTGGTGVRIANGSSYIGGEYDAGIALIPETSDPLLYVFGSYNGASAGTYAIMVIGNVPGER